VYLLEVVSVDFDRAPSERAGPLGVDLQIPTNHRLAALPQPVHVEDRSQVVELVVGGVLVRLPHRSLGHLAVSAEDPDAIWKMVEALARQRHADADREALAERP